MDGIVFKTPKKLHRVEIIRSKDVKARGVKGILHKPPRMDLPLIDVIDITDTFEYPVTSEYSDNFIVLENKTPLKIGLEKLPVDMMPIADAQQQIQDAYEKGFADGQKVTISTYKDELETHQDWVRRFDKVVKELTMDYSMSIKRFEESLVPLAVMTAEHILLHEITHNSSIVIEQTRKAIKALDNDVIFKIHVNPEDMLVLKSCKSELHSDNSKLENVVLSADSSVERGGCILETSVGIVDAKLRTQLERIKESLNLSLKTQESDDNIDVEDDIKSKIDKFIK